MNGKWKRDIMSEDKSYQSAIELRNSLHRIGKIKMAIHDQSLPKEAEKRLLFTLGNIYKGEPVRPSELAKNMCVTLSAVSHHINALEKDGYIERLLDPNDKRVLLISLSEKGKEFDKQMKEKFMQGMQSLVEHLGEEDTQELIRLLGKIEVFLNEKGDRCL